MQRIRVRFGKGDSIRFTSHLDLALAWERLVRRANLPLAYSQGFNPQPRLQLAAALPLGFTSECELIDIWLKEPVPLDELLDRLQKSAPPGLDIQQVSEADLNGKSIQSQMRAVEYQITLVSPRDLGERLKRLMTAETLPRERRGKAYDLRPLIKGIWLDQGGLGMQLVAKPGETGRPDEVLLAMDLDPLEARIHRRALFFQQESK